VRDPRIHAQLTLLHQHLLHGPRRPERQPLGDNANHASPPADPDGETARPLPPTLMPKIRDRLADYWRHQARHHLAGAIVAGLARLPTHLVAGAEELTTAADAAVLDPYLALMAHHVAQAPLYWIDPDYTALATHAGTGLTNLTVTPHELPTTHGLLIWATPITHHHIRTAGPRLPIVAAHWGLIPDGVWVVFYTQSDVLHPTYQPAALQQLRERVGWLAPAHNGVALHHDRQADPTPPSGCCGCGRDRSGAASRPTPVTNPPGCTGTAGGSTDSGASNPTDPDDPCAGAHLSAAI
jgi:hypothetical protein